MVPDQLTYVGRCKVLEVGPFPDFFFRVRLDSREEVMITPRLTSEGTQAVRSECLRAMMSARPVLVYWHHETFLRMEVL